MTKNPITIQFPFGGLNRRYGYQSQPPYTTPDCLNVRPIDSLEGRQRGGMRPGMKKTFDQLIGSGNPIRMLANVTSTGTSVSTWTLTVNNASDFPLNAVFDKSGLNLIMTTDPVIWPYMPEGLTFTQTITGDASDRDLIFKSLDGFGSVSSIEIKNSYLTGTLPSLSLFSSNLKTLDLSGNSLSGTFPAMSHLTGLEELNLSGNSLTGTTDALSTLTALKILTLSGNTNFTWTALPSTLTELYYVDDESDLTVRSINWTSPVGLTTTELWNCNLPLTGEGTILPQTSLQSLKLRYYLASDNTMTKLTFYAKPILKTLDMAYCRLKGEFSLSAFGVSGYTYYQNLETINISNNTFTSFSSINFEYATKVTLFDCTNNLFSTSEVDEIIHACYLNAQNRTISGGVTIPVCTLKIAGTNYPPTTTGKTDAYNLTNLGWTVQYNP